MDSDIKLPIKKTEGETLEDRMTENAYDRVLPARYLNKNNKGEVVEDQEDVFKRVAKNVALPEVVYEAERLGKEVTITPSQVKDNHSAREELVREVFGEEVKPGEGEKMGLETNLTEENVKHLSYDNLVDEIDEDLREVLVDVKEKYQEQMEYLRFMPNTPTIIGAGDELQMLAACFVMSPDDDMHDIHEKIRISALTQQKGGGVGYGFWKLRPKGDIVKSSGGFASGPISFMRTYDQMCSTIAQGGTRRGAQMGVMRISHPDVLQFIHSKDKDVSLAYTLKLNDPDDFTHSSFGEALDEARELIDEDGRVPEHLRNAAEGHLSNFNISVGVTDSFMEAVYNDDEYTFTNPRSGEDFVANDKTVDMYTRFGLGEYVEEGEVLSVPARELWKHIIRGAHENGEPGVVFLERMNKENAFDPEEHPEKRIYSTNPCGEQELFDYDACNLSHINLSTILDEDCEEQDYRVFRKKVLEDMGNPDGANVDESEIVEKFIEQVVDWEDLDERIALNTRFLDNVITMSDYPIEEIEETTRTTRKIGLGIMGYAQMLVQMGVKYGSEAGDEIARQLMIHINDKCVDESQSLAVDDEPGKDRGEFEEWDKSKWSEPVENHEWFDKRCGFDSSKWEDGYPVRNHSHTTIAPTGTTSILGNTSGGCEPIYSVANFRNVSEDVQGEDMLVQFDDFFLRVLEANDIDIESVKKEAIRKMDNNEFEGIETLSNVPNELGELFVTTSDLSTKEHASVQCAFQEGVSSSISKTINAPNDSTVDEAQEAFEYIYDNGGKGVTYYRDGTRNKQVLTTRRQNKQFADEEEILQVVRDKITEDKEFLNELVGMMVEMSDEDKIMIEKLAEELGDSMDESSSELDLDKSGYDSEMMGLSEYRKRPDNLVGSTIRVSTGYGSLYVTLNEDENGNLFEVICEIGKSGGLKSSFTESLGRMISMALRYGVPPERIIKHLSGIKSPKVTWDNGDTIQSIPDGIAYALQKYVNKGGVIGLLQEQRDGDIGEVEGRDIQRSKGDVEEQCPDCGAGIRYEEGCMKCEADCGWSKC